MSIQIRPAVPADAPALLAIYAPYVAQTAITFEYDVPTETEFACRIADTLKIPLSGGRAGRRAGGLCLRRKISRPCCL